MRKYTVLIWRKRGNRVKIEKSWMLGCFVTTRQTNLQKTGRTVQQIFHRSKQFLKRKPQLLLKYG